MWIKTAKNKKKSPYNVFFYNFESLKCPHIWNPNWMEFKAHKDFVFKKICIHFFSLIWTWNNVSLHWVLRNKYLHKIQIIYCALICRSEGIDPTKKIISWQGKELWIFTIFNLTPSLVLQCCVLYTQTNIDIVNFVI